MLLGRSGEDLRDEPLARRRAELEAAWGLFEVAGAFRLSPFTSDRAQALDWLASAGGALDGVVAKRVEDPYRPGERTMVKVKRVRTADCVVGGFRYASGARVVGSLLLGLYDWQGRLDHVGFTSAIAAGEASPS